MGPRFARILNILSKVSQWPCLASLGYLVAPPGGRNGHMIPPFHSKFNAEQLWIHVPSRQLNSLGPFRTRAHLRPQRDCGGTVGASAPTVTNVFVVHTPTNPHTKFESPSAPTGRATALAKSQLWAPVAPPTWAKTRNKRNSQYQIDHGASFLFYDYRGYLDSLPLKPPN